MKRVLASSVLFLTPFVAHAAGGYMDLHAGYGVIDDVDLKSVSTVEAGTVGGSLDYDDSLTYGVEFGVRDIGPNNALRVGLGWSHFKADLDSLTLTASGGTELAAGSYTASSSELDSVGLNFDNDVELYTANLYYDFMAGEQFTPYVGVGAGVADIDNAEDNEFAWTVAAGARWVLTKDFTAGLQANYYSVNGPTDKLGIEYKDIDAYALSGVIGVTW